MKSVCLSWPLLLSLLAAPCPASDYWQKLECAWRQELPAIEADIATSNALLRHKCDAQLYAATRHRFTHIDQESLANYNRGIQRSGHPLPPDASAAVISAAWPARGVRILGSR